MKDSADNALVEHFFRHEYGRLVARLTKRYGVQHLEAVEDAAQRALMRALETWPRTGQADNPSAWLFRVANNALVDDIRRDARRRDLLSQVALDEAAALPSAHFAAELDDEMLQMLFACCDDALPLRSQLVLALKTLCGFSVREIAHRLFLSDANVHKRIQRGRTQLREAARRHSLAPSPETYPGRADAVRRVLYLLFTEGFLSHHPDFALRRELCDEAIRLSTILAKHPAGEVPETFALLALMHLHAARMSAREDAGGALVLLADQDRSRWDQGTILEGLSWLAKSAEGDAFTRYHAEAGIAAEHCMAASFEATRWERVVECYELLERSAPSALHRLNRAVALAEWKGPSAGLALLEEEPAPAWLAASHLWTGTMADLHRRAGNQQRASHFREQALAAAPSKAIREALQRRLG